MLLQRLADRAENEDNIALATDTSQSGNFAKSSQLFWRHLMLPLKRLV